MGAKTKIEWCDYTFNPWAGCSKVATGCVNCFAERMAKRRPDLFGTWGVDGMRVVASESYWRLPYRWNRKAAIVFDGWQRAIDAIGGGSEADLLSQGWKKPHRRRVFCGSMMDVFEDRLELQKPRDRLFCAIDETPFLDWLLLTKRPENALLMMCPWLRDRVGAGQESPDDAWRTQSPPNLWLLYSASTQADLDRGLPHLLRCPVMVRGLSLEPLIESTDLSRWLPSGRAHWQCQKCSSFSHTYCQCHICGAAADYKTGSHVANKRRDDGTWENKQPIDWVIVGGESGPHARPCDITWIRSIRDQCREANVPLFVKQLGARPEARCDDHGVARVGGTCLDNTCRRIRVHDPKGGDPAEWPEDLRVREYPR